MEGIYFYWLAWIGWTYTTFLLEKSKVRNITAIIFLILIIASNKYIELFSLSINSSIFICLVGGYYLLSQRKNIFMVYYLFVSIMLTSAYVSFRLFQIYDPVWVMFYPTFKLAIILILMTLLLVKDQKIRIALILTGVAQGEIIYAVFLNSLVTKLKIGQMESLDIIAIAIFASFLWFAFEKFVARLDKYVKNKILISVSKQ